MSTDTKGDPKFLTINKKDDWEKGYTDNLIFSGKMQGIRIQSGPCYRIRKAVPVKDLIGSAAIIDVVPGCPGILYILCSEGYLWIYDIERNFAEKYDGTEGGANIIANDAGNWFNTFTVDRGTNDGVQRNSTVISGRGLVGRVSVCGPSTSKVISIIDVDSTVSARVTKTGLRGFVKGDIKLKDKGLCRLEFVAENVDVSVGDRVETSGLGGYFPKGIIIGTIKEIRQINSELNRYAIVEPAVDFERIEEVFVLKNKSSDKDR